MQANFDQFIEQVTIKGLNTAIEKLFPLMFKCERAVVWYPVDASGKLFSPTIERELEGNAGVLGFVGKTMKVLSISAQSAHPSFDPNNDTVYYQQNAPILIIPFFMREGSLICFVQLGKNPSQKPFTQDDVLMAEYFQRKFALYSHFIIPSTQTISNFAAMVEHVPYPGIVENICFSLQRVFRCRRAELWLYNEQKKTLFMFDPTSEKPQFLDPKRSGVVGHCILTFSRVLEKSVRDHASYDPMHDGYHDEPVLMQPHIDSQNRCWAIVVRGRANPRIFTDNDSIQLKTLSPFVIYTLSSSMSPPQFEARRDDFEQQLSGLLEVAEALSGVLDLDLLIPTIMEKACELLHSDRCSLFLVDKAKKELISMFHGGLSSGIRMPINRGIVGLTATTGKTVNIADAYSNPQFDRSVDIKTGFRTKSILCAPIYNNSGEIVGVTEMINKIDDNCFNEDDIRMLKAFNVFCGISLDNARLYNASLEMSRQLRTFVDLSSALGHPSTLRNVLDQILENSAKVVNATRATLYLHSNPGNTLKLLVNYGEPNRFGDRFALEAATGKTIRLFRTNGPQETQQRKTRISSLIQRVTEQKDEPSPDESVAQICCVPLVDSEGIILGVLELESQSSILVEDHKLLDCLAIFATVAIERSDLIDLVKLWQVETEIRNLMTQEERLQTGPTPRILGIAVDFSANFDVQQFEQLDLIRIVFAIFERFQLLETFAISNECFFHFIADVCESYNHVVCHDWIHAVDVVQFVAFEVVESSFDEVLTKMELLALMIASICHEVGQDDFMDSFNQEAEIPSSILFHNRPVLEIRYCQTLISLISKKDNNIFSQFDDQELTQIWTIIIQLILATNVDKHTELLKEFNSLVDEGVFTLDNEDHRLLLMELLIKAGDMSIVARPFSIADRRSGDLCNEFFRWVKNGVNQEVDLGLSGMGKENLNESKENIVLYVNECLPLFQAIVKVIPMLECNVRQIQDNLQHWKRGVHL